YQRNSLRKPTKKPGREAGLDDAHDSAIRKCGSRRLGGGPSAADGALVGGHAAVGLLVHGPDELQGGGGPEVGADFLGQAFGSVEDATANHDLHIGAGVELAEVVDEGADVREVGGG